MPEILLAGTTIFSKPTTLSLKGLAARATKTIDKIAKSPGRCSAGDLRPLVVDHLEPRSWEAVPK
jgi:hypothetical protein